MKDFTAVFKGRWLFLILGVVLLAAACSAPYPTSTPIALPPTPTPRPSPTPTPSQGQINERVMLNKLLGFSGETRSTVREMGESGNKSFVFPLVDLVWLGIELGPTKEALFKLTGQALGDDWFDWMEWLGQQDGLKLPYGYAGWKARFFIHTLQADFTQFLYDNVKTRIRLDEIVWGGVPVDGIPDLQAPPFIKADEAIYLTDGDRVFGLSINGEHKAYPLRILDAHEMANDAVGSVPIALAYCTLCGSGIAYERDLKEFGGVTTFGTSGLLYRNNKLMYDRKTRTLWNQFTGEPVVGPLADSGIRLKALPITLTTWQAWRKQHPDTKVLDINTGYRRDYSPGASYGDYFASATTMFPHSQRDNRLETKEWILGVSFDDASKAYPLRVLMDVIVVNDRVGSHDVVLVMEPVSGTPRAYVRRGQEFTPSEALLKAKNVQTVKDVWQFTSSTGSAEVPEVHLMDQNGQIWNTTDEALVNLNDPTQKLERLNTSHVSYWFAWFSFHPKTEVYQPQ